MISVPRTSVYKEHKLRVSTWQRDLAPLKERYEEFATAPHSPSRGLTMTSRRTSSSLVSRLYCRVLSIFTSILRAMKDAPTNIPTAKRRRQKIKLCMPRDRTHFLTRGSRDWYQHKHHLYTLRKTIGIQVRHHHRTCFLQA